MTRRVALYARVSTRDQSPLLQLDALRVLVAVWKFDRFARSTQHLVTALNDFRARNVEFVSVQDGIDTSTAAGRMVFGVHSSQQLHSHGTSER